MKKKTIKWFIVAALLLLGIGFAAGPVVDLDDTIHPVTLPDDLDGYLRAREQRYNDIVPGTEKAIVWANPDQHSPTPVSLVFLHGFTASRQELAPLCEMVAEKLDANVFYQRFTGHGRGSEAMGEVTVNALVNDTYEALEIGKRIGHKVIVMGNSNGGTMATLMGTMDKSNALAALILISPNFGPKRKEAELLLAPWANVIVRLVEGPTYTYDTYNPQHARYWTSSSPSKALLPMMGTVKLARDADLQWIKTPVLVLYSPNDQIVSVDAIKKYYRRFGADYKQIHAVTGDGDPQHHVLAGDILSPQTTQKVADVILKFIQPLL
jgi:esterase/lipase